jgi:hypothetical protein
MLEQMIQFGKLAAKIRRQKGRAGRLVKQHNMKQHLHAAGAHKMPVGMIGFPKGRNI